MKQKIVFSLLFASVVAIWLAYPHILASTWAKSIFPQSNWQARGVIGDSFGALNTLFAGLALAGLAVNIYLQSAQLRKLEAKEEENERSLAAQAEALRLTALLNYYNNEIDRFDRIRGEFGGNEDEETKKKYWERYEEIRTKRTLIVTILTKQNASARQ